MTFTEFQTICTNVKTTGTPASVAFPIIIGDPAGVTLGGYGVTFGQKLVVLKEQVPHAPMVEILNSCRFSFDSGANQVVIAPVTTSY
jgi:hypothetical protein